ncbi:DNA topoisomerase IB [Rhizobiaceae bacterium n13]|uniref:DNA topoisomerase n=1 Tax=Ferirhizobium litorale TaxID=2927786 RepID=A0AAE3U2V9_9HYPH|nr:DNA topoisomerase IB [Fererhizobium litorale]MDI7862865.1 DNA topoisomerase IB [Fererhizobium litorale]MDI7923951.1 DNA topoisomerase IB [Fererhizobium litorale]
MDHVPRKSSDLVYVSDSEPGIRRERRGRGFCYRMPDASLVKDRKHIKRIRALAIPPAYSNVWICMDARGHLQATGRDSCGRKQYLYHPNWQAYRSDRKFDQLVEFAKAIPKIRRMVRRDISAEAETERTVLAALVFLLDETALRVGNRAYAEQNRTYGATTLLKRHLRIVDDTIELQYAAKGGKRVRHRLRHPRLQRILEKIADLPGRQLFKWQDDVGAIHVIDSGTLNAYLCEIGGSCITAKTFRTWIGSLEAFKEAWDAIKSGTVPTTTQLATAAAAKLHNTPSVCKASYIHPSVLALAEQPNSRPLASLATVGDRPRGLRMDEKRLMAYLERCSPIAGDRSR